MKDLEEALALEPRATVIHYPLAMAYRGLGDVDWAQAHLGQRGDIETRVVDPMMWELDDLLQGAVGETMAMTLAELGQYEQAAAVQRDMMATAERAGLRDVVRRLTENLRLYERGKPCRRPFTDNEMP